MPASHLIMLICRACSHGGLKLLTPILRRKSHKVVRTAHSKSSLLSIIVRFARPAHTGLSATGASWFARIAVST